MMATMQIVDRSTIGRGLTPSFEPLVEREAPSRVDVIAAAFGYNNTVVNAVDWMTRPRFPSDPDFNVFEAIKGTPFENQPDRFVGVRSEPEMRSVISRIERETKQRDTIARGGFFGILASMAAGTLDPTVLIPVGGWIGVSVKAGRAGRAAVRAAEGAAVVGGIVTGQELVLQGAQETRTTVESLYAIGGAVIVGSVLGSAVGLLTRAERGALERRLIDVPGTAAEQTEAWAKATGIGAQVTAAGRGTGELADALGAEKVFSFQDPLIRTQTSPFVEARNAVRDLAETPTTLAENSRGIATTIGGSVETRVKMAHGPLSEALVGMDRAYSRYFFGTEKRLAGLRGTIAARRSGKMTYSEFKEAVFDALIAGDAHAIPEVAESAKALRARVFDPLKKDAIDAGLFPEDIKPVGDDGYAPRVYNTDTIRARRPDFVNILARHFEARQKELFEDVAALERRTGADVEPTTSAPKFEELSPAEIKALAEEVTDTILGNSPARILTPADLTAGPRGPLKERVLRIPTSLIRDFVERDPEVLGRLYTRTMAADVNLVKTYGSTDMADVIAKINDEANRAIQEAKAAGKGEKALRKLDSQRQAAIRDITAIRDRIRGNYAIPTNPDGMLYRAGRVVRNLNYLRLLGGMTLSAVPDIARPVMVHGLTRVMGQGFVPMVRNLSAFKLAAKEAKLAGTALDMVLDSRAMAIADIMDDYGRGSGFERAIEAGTRKFGVVSLMAPWNAAIKQFVGVIAQTRILQSVERVVNGKAATKEIEYLAANGIDANVAERIWKQFDDPAKGVREDGIWWANTEAWTDPQAVQGIRAALVRDIDRTIITPGQDKPLWMSTELGKVVGQFRSFNIASVQRTMIAGLQQRDAAAFNGAMLMLALGSLSYYLKARTAGYEVSDDPAKWAVEAFDRSGLAGWLMDANNITEKLTRGAIGASALTGEQATRYASRNALGALLGPSFDAVGDAIQISSSFFSGDWTAADTHAFRKMVPLQNLFYLRQVIDQVEASANQTMGIPMRSQRSSARSSIR